jgi:hypothetical protein
MLFRRFFGRQLSTDWIQTYSGEVYELWNPSVDVIHLRDIAHALALQCRFNGHCSKFYSVAQHSVLAMHFCSAEHDSSEEILRAALMHDAHEAYVGDLVRPMKLEDPVYRKLEAVSARAVAKRFSLQLPLPSVVVEADNSLLLTEHEQLMTPAPQQWAVEGEVWNRKIVPQPPDVAESMFLYHANRLGIE